MNVHVSISSLLVIAIVAICYGLSSQNFAVNGSVLSTHITLFDIQPTHYQKLSYFVLVISLALVCGFILFFGSRSESSGSPRLVNAIVLMALTAFILLGRTRTFQFYVYGVAILLMLAAVAVNIPDQDRIAARSRQKLESLTRPFAAVGASYGRFLPWVLLLILVYAGVVAPFGSGHLVDGLDHFIVVQNHYASTVLSGFDHYCCSETGSLGKTGYGAAITMLVSGAYALNELLGRPATTIVEIVKYYQIAFAALLIVLSMVINPRHGALIAVLMIGTTVFTISSGAYSVGFPNQTGVRFIPAIAGLIVMAVITLRLNLPTLTYCLVAAFFSSLLIMSTPGLGLAVVAGFFVASLLKTYAPEQPVLSFWKWIYAFLIPFLVVTFALLLNKELFLYNDVGVFAVVALWLAGGYGGYVSLFNVEAAIILLFSCITLLYTVDKIRKGAGDRSDIFRGAVATIAIIWMFYYVNRMLNWNVWFYFILLFSILGSIEFFKSRDSIFRTSDRHLYSVILLALAVAFGQIAWSTNKARQMMYGWRAQVCQSGDVEAFGFCLRGDYAKNIENLMSELPEQKSIRDTLVLSFAPTLVRLAGFNERFPWYDPFGDAPDQQSLQDLVAWVKMHRPRFIYTEREELSVTPDAAGRRAHFLKVIGLSGTYEVVETGAHFEVWRIVQQDSKAHEEKPAN